MRLRSTRSPEAVVGPLLAALILPSSTILADSGASRQGTRGAGEDASQVAVADTAETQDDVVVYERVFFDQYNPVTALDVVSWTPGFSVARGSNSRGFGGAGGNILIDGQRPSSKSGSVSDILSRIPASLVQRVELIRGATGGLDVNGQRDILGGARHPAAERAVQRRTRAVGPRYRTDSRPQAALRTSCYRARITSRSPSRSAATTKAWAETPG